MKKNPGDTPSATLTKNITLEHTGNEFNIFSEFRRFKIGIGVHLKSKVKISCRVVESLQPCRPLHLSN